MRRSAALVALCAVLGLPAVQAQAPVPRARPTTPSTRLPLRRVVLYKNGVGYFEHVGRVTGNQPVEIDFNSAQLNDVLKSLTTIDLGNGRIGGVAFNSEAPLAQRLGALPLPIGERTTLAGLLGALRGARLEVRTGARLVSGRLLSVEPRSRGKDGTQTVDELTLVTDSGEIRSVDLTPAVSVKLAERDSSEQVGAYLSLLASNRSQDRRRLTISTIGTGTREVLVGYVSEVPVWKTTYRVVLPTSGTPVLQGWAVVDNTIGEDWDGVELSLVAGAPQSFIQPLSQPQYVQRPLVALAQPALAAPQKYLDGSPAGLTGRIVDGRGMELPGVTVTAIDPSGRRVTSTSDAHGRFTFPALARAAYRLEFSLSGFVPTTIARVEYGGVSQALGDVTMSVALISESAAVQSGGSRGGTVGGVAGGSVATISGASPRAAARETIDRLQIEQGIIDQQASARAQELGDLFEYRIAGPVTIKKNQSALVPILRGDIGVERVSVWNDRSATRPVRALWLTNSSGLTLDGGSFTVLDEATFAGEGLLDPIKPGEKRLLSYAADLGVQVESHNGDDLQQVSRVRIDRGVAVQESEQRARKIYTVRNSDKTPRTIVIEHPIRPGWTLARGPAPSETSLAAYRFAVPVAARSVATLTVEESKPIETRYALSQLSDDQVAVFLRETRANTRISQALAPIQAKKSVIASLSVQITTLESEARQIGEDQTRVRGNMETLKGSRDEQQLLKRYVAQLNQQEDRMSDLRRQIAGFEQTRTGAQRDLAAMLEELSLDVDVEAPDPSSPSDKTPQA